MLEKIWRDRSVVQWRTQAAEWVRGAIQAAGSRVHSDHGGATDQAAQAQGGARDLWQDHKVCDNYTELVARLQTSQRPLPQAQEAEKQTQQRQKEIN